MQIVSLYFAFYLQNHKKIQCARLIKLLKNTLRTVNKMNFKVYPLEVKSSKNYSAISLGRFKEIYGRKIATPYIIHPKNYSKEGELVKVPPYMFPFVFETAEN